jgi:hypothetical protein
MLAAISRYSLSRSDPYRCEALFNHGVWLDSFHNWQPPGCMLHEYKNNDIQECFQSKKLVFAGDSTTRQIFWAVARKLDYADASRQLAKQIDNKNKHTDIEFKSGRVMVQFIWDPFLNSTTTSGSLGRELRRFRNETLLDDTDEEGSAGLILLGAPGLWNARRGNSTDYLGSFKESVNNITPYMDFVRPTEAILKLELPPNLLLVAPIQTPRYELLSPLRAVAITPEKIQQMNSWLHKKSSNSIVWSFESMAMAPEAYEDSGIHVIDTIADQKADVLLNIRCNSASKRYPFDRTCCNTYPKPSGAQIIVIFCGIIVLPVLWYMRRKEKRDVLEALIVFTWVLCMCYLADRTHIFEKAQKQFRMFEFVASCLIILVIGLISVRKIPGEVRILLNWDYKPEISHTAWHNLRL